MTKTVLKPVHTDFESAYLIPDYPYSFHLRCQMRVWTETKKNQGMRVMRCTLNPKTGKWNKPKASTYDTIKVLFVDNETGYLESDGIHQYTMLSRAEAFLTEYAEALNTEQKDDLTRYSISNKVQEDDKISLFHDGAEKFYTQLNLRLREAEREDLILKVKITNKETGEVKIIK